MNNSISFESQPPSDEETTSLRKGKLTRLIEAVAAVESSEAWSTLKTEVFDEELKRMNRLLLGEANKPELNPSSIYKLQGQILSLKRYELTRLAEGYKLELNQLKSKTPSASRG